MSGGAGLMRASISSPGDLFDEVSRNDFALNVGGGLAGYFNNHVGLRGDLSLVDELRVDAAQLCAALAATLQARSDSGWLRSWLAAAQAAMGQPTDTGQLAGANA